MSEIAKTEQARLAARSEMTATLARIGEMLGGHGRFAPDLDSALVDLGTEIERYVAAAVEARLATMVAKALRDVGENPTAREMAGAVLGRIGRGVRAG